MAHLLGYFYHFGQHQIVRLELKPSGGFYITFPNKPRGAIGRSEHQLYWSLVKRDPGFIGDPLFTENKPDIDDSDAAHRIYANYADHINCYPSFDPLGKDLIKAQVDKISKSTVEVIPIPERSKFPDSHIQLIAYRRIVSFRNVLNEVLVDSNKFWKANRNPAFAPAFMKFQLANNIKLIN
jgi:hypothetical protein